MRPMDAPRLVCLSVKIPPEWDDWIEDEQRRRRDELRGIRKPGKAEIVVDALMLLRAQREHGTDGSPQSGPQSPAALLRKRPTVARMRKKASSVSAA